LTEIHSLACVDPNAELGENVKIGPFCVVEAGVKIGDGTVLESHVCVKTDTAMGKENYIAQGVILGGDAQVRALNPDFRTYLEIGDRNVLREYVTVHRAMKNGNSTRIASDCYLMAYTHIAHDCQIGNFVTMANSVGLAGHTTVEDLVTFGGMVGVHQFTRIGKAAMVGGMAQITRDVPPFCIVTQRDEVMDINAVGLRRVGVTQQDRLALHKAVKILFKSQIGLSNAIETVRREVPITEQVAYLLEFEERRFRGKNGRGDQP
jgi:UDP-N-acetylglucosamine acyltransferase